MAVQIPISITLNANTSLALSSPYFKYGTYAGTQWDINQSELIFTRPTGYEAYNMYVIFNNSVIQTTINIGVENSYMLARPLTAGEELQIEVAFYDGNIWLAQTGIFILFFNKRIVSNDISMGELNPTPYLIPGPAGQQGSNGITPNIGANGNWWIGTTDTGVSAAGTVSADTMRLLDPVDTTASLLAMPGVHGDQREALDTGIFYIYYEGTGWQATGGLTNLTNYYTKPQVDSMIAALPTAAQVNALESGITTLNAQPAIQTPEVFAYDDYNTNVFPLANHASFVVNAYALDPDNTFHFLIDSDYELNSEGTQITILNPTLSTGMRVKVVYAG